MNFKEYLFENSTDDAKETLDAIVAALEKQDESKTRDSMLEMGKGMQDWFKKEKSFSPGQARWIYATSKAIFNK